MSDECESKCHATKCVDCLVRAVERNIFENIQDEQEGEMDEEWFDEQLDRCRHYELDDLITAFCDCEAEDLINTYGIHRAIKEYNDEYGTLEANDEINICKTLLYCIVAREMEINYENYKEWCEK